MRWYSRRRRSCCHYSVTASKGPISSACHPNDRIVLRGAYGIFDVFLDTNITLQWAKVPPFETPQTINNTTPAPTFNWANPFQGQPLVAANPNPGQPCSFGLLLNSCSQPNIRSGERR